MTYRKIVATLPILLSIGACSDSFGPAVDAPITGDVVAGEAAFLKECSSCHTSRDGADLAFFHFTDTTIVRRALGHVNQSTAHNIVAYIRTLPVPRTNRDLRIFQPADRVLSSDLDFAMELFGEDAWPEDISSAELAAIDTRTQPTAVGFPLWSVEQENIDWMPDRGVSDGILDFNSSAARIDLDRYYAEPTDSRLHAAVAELRRSVNAEDNADALCVLEPEDRTLDAFEDCFQALRWIASLSAQHMVRSGSDERMTNAIHNSWWDVGQTIRRSVLQRDVDFPNGEEIWTSWHYLSWSFAPEIHASTYISSGLARRELNRHAAFVSLRSQVARREGSRQPYDDLRTAVRDAPVHWQVNVARTGLNHLLERQAGGDLPDEDEIATARSRIITARNLLEDEFESELLETLGPLFDAVIAGLN